MSRRWWKCRRCGVRSSLDPERHRCMTEDVLRWREERREVRASRKTPWTPELQELADYAKKNAMRRAFEFIDNILAMASGRDE